MNKYLKEILKEMCKRVGAKFSKLDFNSPEWFTQYRWTREEEKEFKKWMFNYSKKNKKCYQELYGRPFLNDRVLEEAIGLFLLDYGWMYEKEEIK